MLLFNSGSLAILALGFSMLVTAQAAGKPEDTIKYRHAIMESMSSHVTAILLIATNKIDARQHLQEHADAVANLSGELSHLFPEGSGGSETETLPEIWSDSEKFAAAIKKMQDSALALQEAAGLNDNRAFMGAFATAGKACKSCHESFRAEHDHDDDHDD
jgi:cytochrome c556